MKPQKIDTMADSFPAGWDDVGNKKLILCFVFSPSLGGEGVSDSNKSKRDPQLVVSVSHTFRRLLSNVKLCGVIK